MKILLFSPHPFTSSTVPWSPSYVNRHPELHEPDLHTLLHGRVCPQTHIIRTGGKQIAGPWSVTATGRVIKSVGAAISNE